MNALQVNQPSANALKDIYDENLWTAN